MLKYEDVEKFVNGVISTFKFEEYINLESLTQVIERLGGKINFIFDPNLFSSMYALGVYSINFIDSDNFEFNVYIPKCPEEEINIIEKVKTYRTAFILGILLLRTDYTRDQRNYKLINQQIKTIYEDFARSFGLNLFNENSDPGLFARLLLMQNAKMEEFVSVYSKSKDSLERQRAIEDLANKCSVPFSVVWSRFADVGLMRRKV